MSELEDIRNKKLESLQEQQKLAKQVEMLESFVKQKLTKEALERFGNIKVADPEKAVQIVAVLAQLIQSNNLDKIDDRHMKLILLQMLPKKKDFTITRK